MWHSILVEEAKREAKSAMFSIPDLDVEIYNWDSIWTPGKWHEMAETLSNGDSSDEEEADVHVLKNCNKAMTRIAPLTGQKVEPVSSRLSMEWEKATTNEKAFSLNHVEEACRAICNVIASKDREELLQAFKAPLCQDWYAVYAILENLLGNIKQIKSIVNEVFLRSDGAGCYHDNNLIAAASNVGSRAEKKVMRYDFSEPQSGKDVCDLIISPMKWEICRYSKEGHNIFTAADMHEALKVRQVKGSSVAVYELVSEREELRMKRINNFSFFHNFANERGGLRFSKAYEVGKGRLIPWSELILEEQDPVLLREVKNHGFFATAPRAINQNRNHSQGSSDDNEVMLFHCPEKECCSEFTSSVDLQDHVHRGEHSKRH
ncbi:hypothetical protein AWC38_SpisGene19864 [Stylophora pistillata]|uniref:C2H2-type domain-containing protein n=1 Tax=Stylophora pistillata TaxID=50429 RepID=A0A2B4RHE6_STYPI|nr:hypothetical protein AWC38_SpisGene19864 [Stylophora pistillata]